MLKVALNPIKQTNKNIINRKISLNRTNMSLEGQSKIDNKAKHRVHKTKKERNKQQTKTKPKTKTTKKQNKTKTKSKKQHNMC